MFILFAFFPAAREVFHPRGRAQEPLNKSVCNTSFGNFSGSFPSFSWLLLQSAVLQGCPPSLDLLEESGCPMSLRQKGHFDGVACRSDSLRGQHTHLKFVLTKENRVYDRVWRKVTCETSFTTKFLKSIRGDPTALP